MEKIIKEKISSLLSKEEEVLSVEQLGGMTNQNYLVKTTNKQYIVKFFGKGTEKLINRQDEKYNLELLKDLDLDVKNYLFDIEAGIKVNEYIESAITLDSTSIKTKFDKIAPILQTIHASGKELRGEFAPFEEIKKYVIHTRFSHQIESQICQSVVAQIKYKLSCVDISKQNSEKAKASLETAFKSINYEQVSSNETEKFQKILSEQNYADVIKVFNEKGIAKSIGQYFNIDNSSYCTTVISLLNGSKHNDIVAALLPYFPTEIPR